MLEWTGERYLPFIDPSVCGIEIHYEHLHRYAFASQYVKNKKVLDLASGEGYGTSILSKNARCVVGIDMDHEAVVHASDTYKKENITFIRGSILNIPIKSSKIFDVIVCFEAIEHVSEHDILLQEITRLLKDDGILIISTPNKETYSNDGKFENPYHQKELYFSEFVDLLKKNFSFIYVSGQQVLSGSSIYPVTSEEIASSNEFVIERDDNRFSFSAYDEKLSRYFVAIASNIKLDPKQIQKSYLIDKSNAEIAFLCNDVDRKNMAIQSLESAISVKENTITIKENQILKVNQELEMKQKNLDDAHLNLSELRSEINSLKSSISYRFLDKFHRKIIEPIFPNNSKQRKMYDLGLKGCRIFINDGFGKVVSEYKKRREGKKQSSMHEISQDTADNVHDKTVTEVSDLEKYINLLFSIPEKSHDYIPLSDFPVSTRDTDIKLIAFYLPQFHPIPENDLWWGKGFTEWTNVTKAVPQFAGHYQPRLPDELGFYNLTNPGVMKRQTELAKQYGLYGFCFHYYWFNGKRLLEKPLDMYREHKEFDFPFCICWANENWTRRWDGYENEILIEQKHTSVNNIRFIEDLFPLLRDSRYIKIDGKPLIIIYRPMLLPDIKKMIEEWKDYCRGKGIDDLFIIAASTFGFNEDPKPYGIDALVEFPPHVMPGCPDITKKFTILNKKFKGQIWDFEQFVKSKKYLGKVSYTLFKGICPGWDNTARKPINPSIFYGATPKLYGEWLSELVTWTREVHNKDKRFIFINAWNEWAEGAYLEPDRKYGYGYLDATRNALKKSGENNDNYRESMSQIKKISDNEWLRLLVDSVQKPIINGMKMPGFPPENVQKQFVGSSYEDAIREGYNFFLIIKKYAVKYGISIESTTKILDFGCGWGRITRILLKDFDPENIYGVDVDPQIISICKDTIDDINFFPCNASPPLDFADNTFDIIYAYSVFSHLSEDYALQWIREFSRILKPGGILLATTQSGRFLDFCQSVRDKHLSGGWYDSLKTSFVDIDRCRKDYENGAFLFSPTGGGEYRDKTFYGESIIPEKYIRKTYSKFLEPVDFVDDERILPQALFILLKKKMKSEDNLAKNTKCQVSCTAPDFVSPKDHIKKIILVSHDAHLWGAQMLALYIAKVLKENFHYEVHMLVKSGGRLEEDFKKYSIVYNLERDYPDKDAVEKLVASLNKNNVSIAICNTVVTGDILEILVKNNFRTMSLVHELPGVIQQYKQEKNAQKISKFADTIVFPAEYVKKNFSTVTSLDPAKCRIRPQGLFLKNRYRDRKEEALNLLREKLALPADSKVVLAVGSADFRKGVDLFVQVAKNVIKDNQDVVFVWVGQKDTDLMKNIDPDIENSGLSKKILFVGIRTDDLDVFYSGSDIFLLTSREDPFPSVVLDAMNAGLPVIGFQDAGGFQDIVTDETGVLVPHSDIEKMSERTTFFLRNQDIRSKLGRNAADLIDKQFSFVDYIYFLLEQLGHDYKKVSVIIPNYNYASYLDDRFSTIINQKYPIYEIIFLDDCSSDDSVEKIKRYIDSSPVSVRLLLNESNSGSVFRQWGKGISDARGDYIWIAEADDLSDERFLSEVMKGFFDPDVILSYSQSRQIDSKGKEIGPNYLKYTSEIDEEKWKKNYMRKGTSEICDSLVIKNSIPNVSATVFKKIDITEVLNELIKFKNAGDWYFYVWLLEKGDIYFVSESLNIHRRHRNSITLKENPQSHFNEIVAVQEYILGHFNVDETNVIKALRYRDYVKKHLFGPKGK